MYIKSIVIDGFKSYGKRVEVNGFDTEFNAITGLNGTGKSNILDSICFVLGITNLGHVRAGSLQELIYKSGQAGVSKATVSITFDNSNPDNSPPGFEEFNELVISRQIVMGGKNKYWINGIVVPNKKVQDLFCSVQLNVNNPHFLIMQGRITKVLNMKPHEILAMIEEAAGTRMYEMKRQASQKIIEKKESKLSELNAILSEEVSPKLEKLRQERQSYMEFLRIERELERMMALYQAWLYYATQHASEKAEKKLKAAEDKVKNMQDSIEQNSKDIDEITSEVMLISKEAEEHVDGKVHVLEKKVKEKEKEEAHATASVKLSKDNITAEEKKRMQLEKNRKDDESALISKDEELAKVQNLFQTLKENDNRDNAAFVVSQKKFEAISAGMEVNEQGEAETLQEQLMNAKQAAAQASTEMQTATMELTHCQTTLKQKEREMGSNTADYNRDFSDMQKVEKELKTLENNLSNINYSEKRMSELQECQRILRKDTQHYRERIEQFESYRPHTKFSYRDPEPNFNRSKVFGTMCKLFKVKDPKTATALETAAGGRLYNVVVQDDNTSKQLLKHGQLQTRTTFIPLNKIKGTNMDQKTVKLAQELVGKENVQPAISLIDYDQRLQPAMEFLFGNVFICKDMNVAKQVTFNERIRKKCVTLEGDTTDPAGTLSGGANLKGQSVLLQLGQIIEDEAVLQEKDKELHTIETEIRKMQTLQDQYENYKQRFDLKQHELETVRRRLEQTTHHQQQQEVAQLKENIVHLTERHEECKQIEKKASKKAIDLESKMKDAKGNRENMLKAAQTEMKQLKAQADKSRKEWEKREQDYETLNLEISELKKSVEKTGEEIEKSKEALQKLIEESELKKTELSEFKEVLAVLHAELKVEKAAVVAKNKHIQKKVQKKESLTSINSELELEIKKQDHEVKKLRDDFTNAKAKEAEVARKMRNTDEKLMKDAEALNDKEGMDLQNKIAKSQERRNKLSRTVNAKAQSMFEHEEKQYNALMKKRAIVEGDKKKLLAIIVDLDKQKREALQLAYDQIRKDFGSIFGTLLPGANATLKPPHGKTILEGLEVKVSLGGVWKDSLSELSGGQRSLVALSLILAMLLFKPAPLYILDEVDAALDLSHTQNIGNMLKAHFKQSQFIIVSLKDGMFTNANVLFRTKFIDGMSAVSRTVNKNH